MVRAELPPNIFLLPNEVSLMLGILLLHQVQSTQLTLSIVFFGVTISYLHSSIHLIGFTFVSTPMYVFIIHIFKL